MSLLADLFVAPENEAADYDESPEKFADRAQSQGFTPLELSILWCIVRDSEWDVATMDEFACLLMIDGGERLIHRLPDAMVAELAALPSERIAKIASDWAETDELCWPTEDALEVVKNLADLARRATESDRALFVWNCV